MSLKIDFTPKNFVQLVVVCLYWEHWHTDGQLGTDGVRKVRIGFTTVGHIMKILVKMEFLTEGQAKSLKDSKYRGPYGRMLYRYCAEYYGGGIVSNNLSYIRCKAERGCGKKLNELIRNLHIELTDIGSKKAPDYEKLMIALGLTKESYLATALEVREHFETLSKPALSAIRKNYHERMAEDIEN